jgi:WD40 repeat protein
MDDKPVPEEITCGEQIFDIAFHPTSNVLAAGLIDGAVEIWRYGVDTGANTRLSVSNHHRSSCRGLQFNPSGDTLYSISSDKTIRAVDGQGKQVTLYEHAYKGQTTNEYTIILSYYHTIILSYYHTIILSLLLSLIYYHTITYAGDAL